MRLGHASACPCRTWDSTSSSRRAWSLTCSSISCVQIFSLELSCTSFRMASSTDTMASLLSMINVAKCWGWAADGHSGQSLPCAKSQGQGAVLGVCRDQAPPGVSAVLWWMSVGPGTCPDKAFAAYTNCPYCTPSPVAGSPQGPSHAVPHPHPLAAQALSFRFCSDLALAHHPATASLCHHRDLPVFYVS